MSLKVSSNKSALAAQIRAARALLHWSAVDLSRQSAVSLRTIRRAELPEPTGEMTSANEFALKRVLEAAGVEFIDENGGGPGVRLRSPLQKREADESDSA